MDPVVHFEIPVKNLDKARAFYGNIFGWQLADWPMPDGSVMVGCVTTPVDETTRVPLKPGGINGGILLENQHLKAPAFAIQVASIDERVKQVEAAGGKVIMPKMDMMGIGFYCYVTDPDGTVIGLWQDAVKKG